MRTNRELSRRKSIYSTLDPLDPSFQPSSALPPSGPPAISCRFAGFCLRATPAEVVLLTFGKPSALKPSPGLEFARTELQNGSIFSMLWKMKTLILHFLGFLRSNA
jgi:hypothetical protein